MEVMVAVWSGALLRALRVQLKRRVSVFMPISVLIPALRDLRQNNRTVVIIKLIALAVWSCWALFKIFSCITRHDNQIIKSVLLRVRLLVPNYRSNKIAQLGYVNTDTSLRSFGVSVKTGAHNIWYDIWCAPASQGIIIEFVLLKFRLLRSFRISVRTTAHQIWYDGYDF